MNAVQNNTAANISPRVLAKLQQSQTMKTLKPAMGYSDGVLHYGVVIGGEHMMLTSERRLYDQEELAQNNVRFATPLTDKPRMPETVIETYITKNESVEPYQLFVRIVQFIRRYVVLQNDAEYVLLALWLMGTYLHAAFRYYPYIHLNGEKATGKTLAMEICSDIAFNGNFMIYPSAAVIYRTIEAEQPTLFLDELEQLQRSDKLNFGYLMGVLRSGFHHKGTVPRCVREDSQVVLFTTYCPKMFAGINGLDDVLADRTICLHMVRKLVEETVRSFARSIQIESELESFRSELYVFGLTHGTEIAYDYVENFGDIGGLEHLQNREVDLWAPILCIANHLDAIADKGQNYVTNAIALYSQKWQETKKLVDIGDNDTTKLIAYLVRFRADVQPLYQGPGTATYMTETLWERIHKDYPEWYRSKTALTQALSRILGIGSEPINNGGGSVRVYEINDFNLDQMSRRYSATEYEITHRQLHNHDVNLEEIERIPGELQITHLQGVGAEPELTEQ